MAFKSNCPHCQTQLDLEREWIGMEVECPECGKSFTVRPPVVQKPIPSSVPEQPHYEYPAPIPQYQQNMPPQYDHQQSPRYWQPVQYNAGENPFNFIFPAKYKLRGNLTFFNLLCPGLGHIYLGMVGKGFIFLFLMAALGTAFGFLLDEALSSAYEAIRIEDKIEYVLQHPEFNQRELKNIRSEIYRAKIYQRRSDEYRFFAMCCLPVFILLYCYIAADALHAMDKSCCGEPIKRWEFCNPFTANRYMSCSMALITSLVSICAGITGPGFALYASLISNSGCIWHFFVFGNAI